jgi:hypothetical protein
LDGHVEVVLLVLRAAVVLGVLLLLLVLGGIEVAALLG